MASATAPIRYCFGRFDLQPDERRLRADGVPVHLGPHALDVLLALVGRAGHLVRKQDLLARVWAGVVVEENTLQAQISALRKVLGADAIATVSGQGYRFALPVQTLAEPAAAAAAQPNNLPQPLTRFIGREKEIEDILQGLRSTRLLTLTGAGGCGKTRLALQVAGTLQGSHPGGVRLVELAPLSDPALVVQAVAKALTVQTLPGRDLVETILEWLAPRRMVLVLDNAEHVLDACARLVDTLLRRCAQLVVVATSRERLRIDGEWTYRVPSLSVPVGEQLEDTLACEAARLFVDRARLQRQDFAPTAQDAAALASICRRLDGIALAIELAAAQLRTMSLHELNARLDDRFALLTGGSRAALPRHRTLRSLIDWSHDLLRPPEQMVLRRASVFAGGWTLDAAERVCSGPGVEAGAVLHLLGALVDKNLIVAEAKGDHTRFGMLDTVRDYAQQHLRDSGEWAAVHDGLTDHLIALAAGLDAQQDRTLLHTLRRCDAEHDNLRVALAWCEGDPARALKGLQLAALLLEFWHVRGHYGEGLAWLARLQAVVPAGERGEIHATALHAWGWLLIVDSDQAAGAARLREAIDVWQQLGDRWRAARSMVRLVDTERYGAHPASVIAACQQALPVAREFGDLRTVADSLHSLAEVARIAGDYSAAERLLDESLTVSRAIGGWATATALNYRGALEYSRGDHERARATWQMSLPGYRESGDRSGTAAALMHIAIVSQLLGDIAAATSWLREAWNWLPGGNDNELLWWLDAFAGLLVARGSAADAARVWGCVARHREERGLERPDAQRYQRLLDAAHHALQDDAAFQRAWNEGWSWSLPEAGSFARDFNDRLPP